MTTRDDMVAGGGADYLGATYGIVSPKYQSYSTGPGLQPGQGTPADVGYNGNAPGAGESYAASALGYYGSGNIPGVSNNQQQNYQSFSQQPGLAPKDMSSYYDNAQRLSDNAINTQMAARGSFGSSAAVGQLSNADTNLRAQQARDEAQYGLQRDAASLQRAGLSGQFADGADVQSNAASRNQLDWTQGLGNLAFGQQQAGMQRYEQGNAGAMQAAGVLSGLEGSNYANANNADADHMDQAMNAYNGYATQRTTQAHNDRAETDNNYKDGLNAALGIAKLGVTAGMA